MEIGAAAQGRNGGFKEGLFGEVTGSELIDDDFTRELLGKGGETGGEGEYIFDLFRKEKNTGEFKGLSEPMQLRYIGDVTKKAGIDLKGIKTKIVRDPTMIGRGCFGYTFPDGKAIHLYPDAFTDLETLIKTIAHERMHIYQVRTFGVAKDSLTIAMYEKAAREAEIYWWDYYLRGGR